MSTIQTTNLKNAASVSNNIVLDASGNAAFAGNVTASGNVTSTGMVVPSSSFLRNRIINGAMAIDQRNAGASVTVNSGGQFFTADRFYAQAQGGGVFTIQQSSTAPTGFTNSIIATVTTADTSLAGTDFYVIKQRIEGFNSADLGWGAAGAQTVTLSFWVRSSITGTYTGALINSAENRSYPFSYSISAANTFEYKTVTIAGDTTGTWVTNNGIGISVGFALGVGSTYLGTAGSWAGSRLEGATGQTAWISTNGATFYLTGVQLEVGTVATPFERRQYGQELALCQRYYLPVGYGELLGVFQGPNNAVLWVNYPVQMRASPTTTFPSLTNAVDQWGTSPRTPSAVTANASTKSLWSTATGMSGAVIGNPAIWIGGTITLSAEL